jgi:hypothetical protein
VSLGLKFETAGYMSVYIHFSSVASGTPGVSLSRFPVDISGSTITIKHRAVVGRDDSRTLHAGSVIAGDGGGRRGVFISLHRLADYTAADGSMQIKATVRASVPGVTVLE